MKRSTQIIIVLTICALGGVIATGATPSSSSGNPVDQINDSDRTLISLTPADSPNGDEYASITNGELVISVDTITNVQTDYDTLFVVTFAGVDGSTDPAQVWINSSTEQMDFYRMDTKSTITDENNTVELEPGESVEVGMSVGGDEPVESSFTQTVTYNAKIPSTDGGDGSDGDDGSDGSDGDDGSDESDGGDSETEPPVEEPARTMIWYILPLVVLVGLIMYYVVASRRRRDQDEDA